MGLSWNYIFAKNIMFSERKKDWNSMDMGLSWNYMYICIFFMFNDKERDWNSMHMGLSWKYTFVHFVMFSERKSLKFHVSNYILKLHFLSILFYFMN
jgi:hypothetical protein